MSEREFPQERGAWHGRAIWMRKQGHMRKVIAAELGVSLRAVSNVLNPQSAEARRAYNRDYMRRRRAKESAVKLASDCE